MTDTFHTDVLVVGAGPTGLTLAIELARRGITCRIIDQASTYPIGTRGTGISGRTQEVFDDLGILERISAYAEPDRLVRFYGPGNQIEREVPLASSRTTPPTPDAPYRALFLVSQQHTEAVLRERLTSLGVSVEMDSRLVGLTQRAEGVVATVTHAGKSSEIQARYLVGCDGGHSSVRKDTGISFLGETWDEERYLLANINVSGVDPAFWHIWTDPTWGTLALNWMSHSNIWFFIASVLPDEQGVLASPTLETIQRLFDERIGIPGVHFDTPIWLSAWHPNIRMVDQYRRKRIFLAGDAAHVHSAAGGQGLNTGVQDAYNLGWKLASVLSGTPEMLLDTYQEERLPIAQGVLASTSTRHREFMHRNFGQAAANLLAGREVFADATQLSLTYRGSRLSRDLDNAPGIRAGDRAPDAPGLLTYSGEQLRLFDLFRGTHFTLLIFGEQPALQLPAISRDVLRIYSITHSGDEITPANDGLIDSGGHAFHAYGVSNQALILVRPDGYIGLTGESEGATPIMDYLRDVAGR